MDIKNWTFQRQRRKYQGLFCRSDFKFYYPNNIEEFDDLLEIYTRKKSNYTENDLGENMILDKVIVMDDVSGLADRSGEFANFLTVSQKYGQTYVYVFPTIYPTRRNWQMIMSQTKIFNFFRTLFKLLWLIKFCHLFQIGIKITVSIIEIFGSIDCIMKFLTLDRKNPWQWTHVMLMS